MQERLEHGAQDPCHDSVTLSRMASQAPLALLLANSDGAVMHANQAAQSLFGAPVDVFAAPLHVNRELFARARGGETVQQQVAPPGPPYLLTLGPSQGGVIVSATDMVDIRRDRQELLRARAEADAGVKSKSDFLASMSHELRTPLNSVIGFSQVLREQFFGPLNERQSQYVRDIEQSGRQLLELINGILDLSRLDANRDHPEVTRFGLGDVTDGALMLVREKSHKHRISLNASISDADASRQMECDVRMVKQVLHNLLSNAVKFTPEGGSVTLAVRVEEGMVNFAVSDTGSGIAREFHESIFREFFQLRSGIVSKTPGTGLGLPIARRYAELLGGRVTVASEGENMGSTFTFVVPLTPILAGTRAAQPHAGTDWFAETSSMRSTVAKVANLSHRQGRPFSLCRFEPCATPASFEMTTVASVLSMATRNYDIWFTARGDGLAYLLLLDSGHSAANAVCERMLRTVQEKLGASVRFAVATFPEDGESTEELLATLARRGA